MTDEDYSPVAFVETVCKVASARGWRLKLWSGGYTWYVGEQDKGFFEINRTHVFNWDNMTPKAMLTMAAHSWIELAKITAQDLANLYKQATEPATT
jgi:hypothetical protein